VGGLTTAGPRYQLMFSDLAKEVAREVGENVFLSDLQDDYKVYLFYYPGVIPYVDLEIKLKGLGQMTGKNLFVNIGRLNDPNFGKQKSMFGIKDLPVVIITGINGIASVRTERYYSTAYVRLDSKRILESADLTIRFVERILNLFIGGEISEALIQYKDQKQIAVVKMVIVDSLKSLANFLSDRDISVSLLEGKFELRRTGG